MATIGDLCGCGHQIFSLSAGQLDDLAETETTSIMDLPEAQFVSPRSCYFCRTEMVFRALSNLVEATQAIFHEEHLTVTALRNWADDLTARAAEREALASSTATDDNSSIPVIGFRVSGNADAYQKSFEGLANRILDARKAAQDLLKSDVTQHSNFVGWYLGRSESSRRLVEENIEYLEIMRIVMANFEGFREANDQVRARLTQLYIDGKLKAWLEGLSKSGEDVWTETMNLCTKIAKLRRTSGVDKADEPQIHPQT